MLTKNNYQLKFYTELKHYVIENENETDRLN